MIRVSDELHLAGSFLPAFYLRQDRDRDMHIAYAFIYYVRTSGILLMHQRDMQQEFAWLCNNIT